MNRNKLLRIRQAGVGLVELMISITIGLGVVAAMLAVFSATNSSGRQSETGTRMSEDAAVAMNYMAGYIRMAGYSTARTAELTSSVTTAVQRRPLTAIIFQECTCVVAIPASVTRQWAMHCP